MTSAKTVLVPLDGSVHATAAMPVARGFAELLSRYCCGSSRH